MNNYRDHGVERMNESVCVTVYRPVYTGKVCIPHGIDMCRVHTALS